MLVLSRKQGQSIVIAGEIVVSIVELSRGRVQIGIEAPPHLTIHREEIHRRIQAECDAKPLPANQRADRRMPAGQCVGSA